jgi:hypothetical protein
MTDPPALPDAPVVPAVVDAERLRVEGRGDEIPEVPVMMRDVQQTDDGEEC